MSVARAPHFGLCNQTRWAEKYGAANIERASAGPASTPSVRVCCGYYDALLSRRLARAAGLLCCGLSCSNLRVGAEELDRALLRHPPPHEAIVGGHNNMAPVSLDETFEFAGGDPAVHLCRADATSSRELADRLSIGVLELFHRVVLGIDQDRP